MSGSTDHFPDAPLKGNGAALSQPASERQARSRAFDSGVRAAAARTLLQDAQEAASAIADAAERADRGLCEGENIHDTIEDLDVRSEALAALIRTTRTLLDRTAPRRPL